MNVAANKTHEVFSGMTGTFLRILIYGKGLGLIRPPNAFLGEV